MNNKEVKIIKVTEEISNKIIEDFSNDIVEHKDTASRYVTEVSLQFPSGYIIKLDVKYHHISRDTLGI